MTPDEDAIDTVAAWIRLGVTPREAWRALGRPDTARDVTWGMVIDAVAAEAWVMRMQRRAA